MATVMQLSAHISQLISQGISLYDSFLDWFLSCCTFENFMHVYNQIQSLLLPFPLPPFSTSPLSILSTLCLKLHHIKVKLALSICAWVWNYPLKHGRPTNSHIFRKMVSSSPATLHCQWCLRNGKGLEIIYSIYAGNLGWLGFVYFLCRWPLLCVRE